MQPVRLIAVLILVAAIPTMAAETPAKKKIIVIAHRGVHDSSPENTLSAIQKAIDLGCDYVEVDVRRTRGGALVLMHDKKVDRTTDGKGEVKKLTLAEIRKFTVGKKDKVPTFEETLKFCRGKIKVYIDNKAAPPAEVIAAVERHQMIADVIVYGSVEELREFKKLNRKIWIMPSHPGSAEKIAQLCGDLKPETLDGHVRDWTAEQARAAHAAGAQIWVDNLGINDNETGFQKSINLGVDAIQTDHPAKLLKFLKREGYR